MAAEVEIKVVDVSQNVLDISRAEPDDVVQLLEERPDVWSGVQPRIVADALISSGRRGARPYSASADADVDDPPEILARALADERRRPFVQFRVAPLPSDTKGASAGTEDAVTLNPATFMWARGAARTGRVAAAPDTPRLLLEVRAPLAGVPKWSAISGSGRQAARDFLRRLIGAVDNVCLFRCGRWHCAGKYLSDPTPAPPTVVLDDADGDGVEMSNGAVAEPTSEAAPAGEAARALKKVAGEMLGALDAGRRDDPGGPAMEPLPQDPGVRFIRALATFGHEEILAALAAETFDARKLVSDSSYAATLTEADHRRRMLGALERTEIRASLLRQVVARFFPAAARRLGLDSEGGTDRATALKAVKAASRWTESRILAALTAEERRRAKTELAVAIKAWKARVENTCPHVVLVQQLLGSGNGGLSRRSREALVELEAFVGGVSPTRTSGRPRTSALGGGERRPPPRRRDPPSHVMCRRCRMPAVCGHVLAAARARMASFGGREAADGAALAALAPYIDTGRGLPGTSPTSTIQYCRVCGEALGEYSPIDASVEVEIALGSSGSDDVALLLRQEGLRIHHQLKFPFVVSAEVYSRRLSESVRSAYISVLIARGIAAEDPLRRVVAAAAAAAFVFSQATASPPPVGAPTAYRGVGARRAVPFAGAILRDLADRFSGGRAKGSAKGARLIDSGRDALAPEVTPEFVKRLVLEVRDLVDARAAGASFERPRQVEAFVRRLTTTDPVYAAARAAYRTWGKGRGGARAPPKTPRAEAVALEREIAAVLGRTVEAFVAQARKASSKKTSRTALYKDLWVPAGGGRGSTSLPKDTYLAFARHMQTGSASYSLRLVEAAAAAWPRTMVGAAPWHPAKVDHAARAPRDWDSDVCHGRRAASDDAEGDTPAVDTGAIFRAAKLADVSTDTFVRLGLEVVTFSAVALREQQAKEKRRRAPGTAKPTPAARPDLASDPALADAATAAAWGHFIRLATDLARARNIRYFARGEAVTHNLVSALTGDSGALPPEEVLAKISPPDTAAVRARLKSLPKTRRRLATVAALAEAAVAAADTNGAAKTVAAHSLRDIFAQVALAADDIALTSGRGAGVGDDVGETAHNDEGGDLETRVNDDGEATESAFASLEAIDYDGHNEDGEAED
jgi:hypothetical protein